MRIRRAILVLPHVFITSIHLSTLSSFVYSLLSMFSFSLLQTASLQCNAFYFPNGVAIFIILLSISVTLP